MINLTRDEPDKIKILINDFLISDRFEANEDIMVAFLKFLQSQGDKIEDGALINEILDLIARKFA